MLQSAKLESRSWWNASGPGSRFWARRRRHGTRSSRRQFLPRVDLMEDRTLLSTVTVTNNNDNGPGSLRAAIASATGGETIDFASRLKGETITLTSGPLVIGVNLTIDGLGADKLNVSGGGTRNVFTVSSGVTATIENLTIAQGLAVQGGGIDNFGKLTVANCVLLDNEAVGGSGDSTTPDAANGGGIANELGASLTVTNSTFNSNVSAASLGDDSFGGGLLNLAGAIVTGCTFTGNQLTGGSNTSYYAGSYGAGIESWDNSTLILSSSTFTGNQATVPSGPYYGDAGALDVEYGAVATVNNGTFTHNVGTGGAGSENGPGAVSAYGCTLTFNNSSFTDNQCIGGSFNSSVPDGGGALGALAVYLYDADRARSPSARSPATSP